ncbi:MAG: hypothetical protein HQL70_03410 [Magnetococcales bacterium]|nr:hypothetical protein [Magnetococcales bacterium]
MDTKPRNATERRIYWLAIAKHHPPEWLASYVESQKANLVIVTENGPAIQKERSSAYLENIEDAPYFAFALAKSYLDDVGEWPLAGIATELALVNFEEQIIKDGKTDITTVEQSVRAILKTVQPIWPELDVVFFGEELG